MNNTIMNLKNSLFTLPKLKEYKTCAYVEFYYTKTNGERDRQRMYVTKLKGKQRKFHARKIIDELTKKLYDGWTPEKDQEAPMYYKSIEDVIKAFQNDKLSYYRGDSVRSMESMCKWLINYCNANEIMTCIQINQNSAQKMAHSLSAKGYRSATYNNYVRWFKLIGNWCVEMGYMKANPWNCLKRKPKHPKLREPIPDVVMQGILNYWKIKNYRMLAFIHMWKDMGLRGAEILRLRKEDIKISESVIFKPGAASKNRKHNLHTIPTELVPLMRKLYHNSHANEYLFSQGLHSGPKLKLTKYVGHFWTDMRVNLKLSNKYQMASLRDTGIINMLNSGISPERVAKQYHHSSLEITSIYAMHINKTADDEILALKIR